MFSLVYVYFRQTILPYEFPAMSSVCCGSCIVNAKRSEHGDRELAASRTDEQALLETEK
jgi:hypothetical protein